MSESWQQLHKQNPHPRDASITFDEPTHVYTIKGSSKSIISCTKFVHNCFPHFDADAVVKKMMASPNWSNNKLFGKTAQEIKNLWETNRNTSSSQGTAMHLAIEKFMNGAEHLISEEMKVSKEWKYFTNFWKDVNTNLVPFRTEWCVWSEEYKLAGSIDMVFYRKSDDSYVIYDWKRSKEIKTDNPWESALDPISHLPSCNYWQYTLQLNAYRWFLETYYGLKISDMCIVVFHPDNSNYKLYHLNRLDDEISDMLEARLARLKGKHT
jgi:ATP-dependent exoDNAse (exonuclease V) beta subunit